jgi:hypothetical protein
MASLALGAIGGYFFGPIGFMVGSALGNLLDPQKSEGPRIEDKRLQGSSYGEPIPIIYGTMRLAGQVIWTTDLQEHKNTSGGKGGPQVTTYTYSASFSVLLCEGPVAGLLKVWADGAVVYDATGGSDGVVNEDWPMEIYLGGEDQLPDPTEEAVLGVGNVPAYRGVCRFVMNDLGLGAWGNRIPQITALVYTSQGGFPWRVSEFDPFPSKNPGAGGNPRANASYDAGVITTTTYNQNTTSIEMDQFVVDGTPTGSSYGETTALGIGSFVRNSNWWSAYFNGDAGSVWNWRMINLAPPEITIGTETPEANFNPSKILGNMSVYISDCVYTVGNDSGTTQIARFAAPNGTPGNYVSGVALDTHYSSSDVSLGTSDTGHLYVIAPTGVGDNCRMWKFDADLSLVHFWDDTDTAGVRLQGTCGNFHVHKDYICVNYLDSFLGVALIALVKIDAGYGLSDHPQTLTHTSGFVVNLSGGLMLDSDGVFSLDPPAAPIPLSEIVGDISDRCGLDASEYDVSALTPLVSGFMISRQSTGRDNILQLRTAYFFDAVESSAAEVFVMRGGASQISIADNDLAAQTGGGAGPPLVEVKRGQEVDLPATMYTVYVNPDADYQNNTQYARRLVTQSQATARVDLAIALPDESASAIASKLLYTAWLERTKLVILTSSQFLWYEPTDVITAHGYVMRIVGKSTIASGIVQFDAVVTSVGVFISGPVGAGSGGFNPPIVVGKLPTALLLLDIPLVLDTDLENGMYAGMAGDTGATGANWPGGVLNKSTDAGATYVSVGTLTVPTVMGVATTALGDFQSGNIFDELNAVTLLVGPGGGELTSATELAVLNGANMLVLGREILQYRTATLTAPGTYELTGLLRGRRGTEWAIAGHSVGDQFAALPGVLDFPIQFAELSLQRLYKAVTLNAALASATAVPFTCAGVALQPYAPVQLGGGSDAGGDTTLQWTRRTRKGGAWQDFVNVPLSEATEEYVVQIWGAGYAVCARVITGVILPTTVYTAAQQIADFGVEQETVYFTVGQVGAYSLGTQARGTAPGIGTTDDQPLVPIPPYASPPGPPPGPTNPTNITLAWDGSNSPQYTSGFNIGNTFVVEFTTDTDPIGPGNLSAAEFGNPAYYRTAVLSTDSGGINVLATRYGNTIDFIFGTGSGQVPLSISTTYYAIFRTALPDGSPSGTLGDPCNMVISF